MAKFFSYSFNGCFYHFVFPVLPQIVPFDFGDDDINSGESISAMCTITKGDLPIKINWFLNDKPVNMFDGIIVNHVTKKMSTLSIESVDASHTGHYTCSASNMAGNVNYTAVLSVNGT